MVFFIALNHWIFASGQLGGTGELNHNHRQMSSSPTATSARASGFLLEKTGCAAMMRA
jgi:hypothetical protein